MTPLERCETRPRVEMAPRPPPAQLEIRLLGGLALLRSGRAVPLPASRRTRALLGFLVAQAGRPQTRARLCELLWDGPTDPRAALRWSLTKLRPLVDDRGVARLRADRDTVSFDPAGAVVDLLDLRRMAGEAPDVTLDALRALAARARGELLEGLEVSDAMHFEAWCTAERESARRLRAALLARLADRDDLPGEESLAWAQQAVADDPLGQAAHARVVLALARLGRPREALRHFQDARDRLRRELNVAPSNELERARLSIPTSTSAGATTTPSAPVAEPSSPLVGRADTMEALDAAWKLAAEGKGERVVLLVGEPGVGKTRLLDELATMVGAAGARVLRGRAFEAETTRPFGPWHDALSQGGMQIVGGVDREQTFETIAGALRGWAAERPCAVLLDDLQWADEVSTALLHWLARTLPGPRVLLVAAARGGELAENAAVQRTVSALAGVARLRRVELAALDAADTERLVRATAPAVDAARVHAESRGNPLFAIELARALAGGEVTVGDGVEARIRDRLDRLEGAPRELLPWAAAMGREVAPEVLSAASGLTGAALLGALEALEGRGILRSVGDGGRVDFAHDLVRDAAYRSLSGARRRVVHRAIALALAQQPDPGGAQAGEVARHAALGGDAALAARSFRTAAEHALQLFAPHEARELARRGLEHVEALDLAPRVGEEVALWEVRVRAGDGPREALEAGLRAAIERARAHGAAAETRRGYFALSLVHYVGGELGRALEDSQQAARAGRAGDPATAALSLADSAQCLALIERELPRAHALAVEARTIADRIGVEVPQASFALGLLARHGGDVDAARSWLEDAVASFVARRDHWHAFEALARLAMTEIEAGRPDAAGRRSQAMRELAARLGDGSDGALAAAVEALAASDDGALATAIEGLRAADAKARMGWALSTAAEAALARHDHPAAGAFAERALACAEAVGRRSDATVARAVLGRVAAAQGDLPAAQRHEEALRGVHERPDEVSARARRAMAALDAALDGFNARSNEGSTGASA